MGARTRKADGGRPAKASPTCSKPVELRRWMTFRLMTSYFLKRDGWNWYACRVGRVAGGQKGSSGKTRIHGNSGSAPCLSKYSWSYSPPPSFKN